MKIALDLINKGIEFACKSSRKSITGLREPLFDIVDSGAGKVASRPYDMAIPIKTPGLGVLKKGLIGKGANGVLKTEYELEVESQKRIEDIIINHLKEEPEEYERLLEYQKKCSKYFIGENLERKYILRYADDLSERIKLTPQEEEVLKDYIAQNESYLQSFELEDPLLGKFASIVKTKASSRSRAEADFIWTVRDSLDNNGLYKYEDAILNLHRETTLKKCTSSELNQIRELISNYSLSKEELLGLLQSDLREIINRDVSDLIPLLSNGADIKKNFKKIVMRCKPFESVSLQDYLRLRSNLFSRYTDIKDFGRNWQTILKMSDEDYKVYQKIKGTIPSGYVFKDVNKVARFVELDESILRIAIDSRYSEEEILKLIELKNKNPNNLEFIMQQTKKSTNGTKDVCKYNYSQVENLFSLMEKSPDLAKKYIKEGKDFNFIQKILEAINIDEKLTNELLATKVFKHSDDVRSYSPYEIKSLVSLSKKDPELFELLTKKIKCGDLTLPDETSSLLDEMNNGKYDLKFAREILLSGNQCNGSAKELHKILQYNNTHSQIVKNLFNLKKNDGVFRFSVEDINCLIPLYEKDSQTFSKLLSIVRDGKPLRESEISCLFEYMSNNPGLTDVLLSAKQYASNVSRFDAGDVVRITLALEQDKGLTLDLLKRTTIKDPNITFAYSACTIEIATNVVQKDGGREFVEKLLTYTYKDRQGKVRQLIPDISMTELLEDYNAGKNTDLIQKLLSNKKYTPFLISYRSSYAKELSNPGFMETILPYVKDSCTKVVMNTGMLPNTRELRLINGDECRYITCRISPDNKTFEILSSEKTLQKDNTAVLSTIDKGEYKYQKFNLVGGKVLKDRKSVTLNPEDKSLTMDIVTPSSVVKGEYDILHVTRDASGTWEKKALASSKRIKNGLKRTVKSFTSSDGTKTTYVRVEGKKGFGINYQIKAKNGKVILKLERQFKRIDENHFQSVLNGQKYDILFKGDEIVVSKITPNGTISETITLGPDIMDPELKELYKKLPGDYFFKIKQAGIKKVAKDPSILDNANFNSGENSINIGEYLIDNPFVFSHELGHAIDRKILKTMNKDKKLIEIYRQELEAFTKKSSNLESGIIDYFTQKFVKGCDYSNVVWNHSLGEVIAETHALLSGLENSFESLGMRSVVLQENFPRTISYIANRVC